MRIHAAKVTLIAAVLMMTGCSNEETTNKNMGLGNVGIDCNGADSNNVKCRPPRDPDNAF